MKHCPNTACAHLATTGRAGEYRDEIDTCNDCGERLAAGGAPEPDAGRHEPQWAAAITAPDQQIARLAQAALKHVAIPSQVKPVASEGGSIVGGAPTAMQILVPDAMLDEASLVLQGLFAERVALPDEEDLEFVDENGEPLDAEGEPFLSVEHDTADAAGITAGAGESHEPSEVEAGSVDVPRACPRCASSGVTSHVPESPGESRGLLKRLFGRRTSWRCLACGNHW